MCLCCCCTHSYIFITIYKHLWLCNVICIYIIFSGLIIWYWITNWCAPFWGELLLPLSTFLKFFVKGWGLVGFPLISITFFLFYFILVFLFRTEMYLFLFEIISKNFKECYSLPPQLIRFILLVWVLVDNKQYKDIHLYMFSWSTTQLLDDEDKLISKINCLKISR